MNSPLPEVLKDLEAKLGHTFAQPALLEEAVTHRSYAHEHDTPHNERLEWLGDAVLQSGISRVLFTRLSSSSEGQLSRARAKIVNTDTLAKIARAQDLGAVLRLGRGEEVTGGRERTRVLASTVEALLGAVHQDAGPLVAFEVVERWFDDEVSELLDGANTSRFPFKDPRSLLQEHTQRVHKTTPNYKVTAQEGPPHAPTFTVQVRLDQSEIGTGVGGSKRDAARAAALDALTRLG